MVPNVVLDHLLLREGKRNRVYKDSLGKLTVGVGHLVQPEDNLKLGDMISDMQIEQFLKADAQKAYSAAVAQATELGHSTNMAFIVALSSVNFQLGTGWYLTHKRTWKLLKARKYREAAEEIKDSLWYAQTPVRVRDFEAAILALQTS